MIFGILIEILGLIIAYTGWRIVQSTELPPGTRGFEGVLPNSRGIKSWLGTMALGLGLMLIMIFGPMFFMTAK